MASKFTDFVLRLAEDPELLAQFQRDPEHTVQTVGLTAAEQSILLNPTPRIVRDAIANEIGLSGGGEAAAVIVVVYTWTKVTGPDAQPTETVVDRLRRLSQPIR